MERAIRKYTVCVAYLFSLVHFSSFVVVSFSRQRFQTPAVKRTLNPVWDTKDATFQFAIYLSLIPTLGVVELVLWDKDTFRKDYLGEVSLAIEDWFKDGIPAAFDHPKNEVCPIMLNAILFFLLSGFIAFLGVGRLNETFDSLHGVCSNQIGPHSGQGRVPIPPL